MIRVVTIGGEYGSGRAEIARQLAGVLGWRLLDNDLIERIAARARIDPDLAKRYDECTDPWFHRVQKALWRGGYEGVASTSEDVFDADAMAEIARLIIEEAARQGNCVIVGRGGQCVLQNRADVFHVFTYGSRSGLRGCANEASRIPSGRSNRPSAAGRLTSAGTTARTGRTATCIT